MAADLEEVLKEWHQQHIVHGEPPGPRDNEDRASYLLKRFRQSTGEIMQVEGDSNAAVLVAKRRHWKLKLKEVEATLDGIEGDLKATIGDALGIEGPFGRLTWEPRQGRPSYKDCLVELAGSLDVDLLDRHRGQPFRVLQDRAPKE
jgi:hypothetical protein